MNTAILTTQAAAPGNPDGVTGKLNRAAGKPGLAVPMAATAAPAEGQPPQTPTGESTANLALTAEKITAGFESAMMKSLPPEILEKILSEIGGEGWDKDGKKIPPEILNALDVLTKIDKLLQGRSISINPESTAQTERIEQWLRIAIDNPKLAGELIERIPVVGAKELAELLDRVEKILTAIATPTGGGAKNTRPELPSLQNVIANANRSEVIAVLSKNVFGDTLTTLLNLVKQLDSSPAAVNTVQMESAEARKIVSDIANRLPELSSLKTDFLHDPKQVSPQNIEAEITTPQKSQTQGQTAAVTQIRAEITALTETAVHILAGGDSGEKAVAAVGEKINALKELIGQARTDETNIGKTTVADNRPVLTSGIKQICINIINDLKNAVDSITGDKNPINITPDGRKQTPTPPQTPVSTMNKLNMLSIVRDAVISLDAVLRPLVREERPVPQNFYNRVAAAPEHQITTEAKNTLFKQIGTAQEAVRNLIESLGKNITNIDTANPIARQDKKNPAPTGGMAQNTAAITMPATNSNTQTPQPPKPAAIASLNATPEKRTEHTASEVKQTVNTAQNKNIPLHGKTAQNTAAVTMPATNNNTQTSQPPKPAAAANLNAAPEKGSDNIASEARQVINTAQRIWITSENLRAGFQETFASLDLQSRASPLDPSAGPVAQIIRQSVDALRVEILLEASAALRDVFSSIEGLREAIEQLTDKPRVLPEAEEALIRAARNLEQEARQGGAEAMEKLKDVLKELNRLQSDVSRPQQDTANTARTQTPADVIRSAALTAARGLENLSLLTAQPRGAEVQQQVIALPVKMGQEWAEVQVKIVKDKRKSKNEGEKNKHVSIYLNTAPSKLGEITAHFDFHPPANLRLSVQFEKPEVTKWFKEQANELREALSQAGLPGTTLEFRNKRVVREKDTADTNVNIIKDDKVDYRV